MYTTTNAGAFRDVAESSRALHRTIAPVEGKMVISSTHSNRNCTKNNILVKVGLPTVRSISTGSYCNRY